jgi:hypothetical protein
MRVNIKWFLTGKVSHIEERDDLLGPSTTVLEVKGLIQLKYSYPAKHMLVIVHKSLRENEETLASFGIVDQESADDEKNLLTVHVLSGAELEGEDDEDDDDDDGGEGSSINEFSHDDFIKACKMLGRDLPVSAGRSEQVRAAPPRARPTFVDAKPVPLGQAVIPTPAGTKASPSAPATTQEEDLAGAPETRVKRIFTDVVYGLRKEGVEKSFALAYPGIAEPLDFWDMRLAQDRVSVAAGEIAVDLFYYGEIDKIDPAKLHQLVSAHAQQLGFRVRPVGKVREAGCMYPLIAAPFVMSALEADQLGNTVFERWGVLAKDLPPVPQRTAAADGPAGQPGQGKECSVM